ncbi:MAG: hypothetical protein E4G89_03050 [Methanothrix sp.]|nr:MAG: hypothetical protein E4G89_03050 [Methanothrix sp.]
MPTKSIASKRNDVAVKAMTGAIAKFIGLGYMKPNDLATAALVSLEQAGLRIVAMTGQRPSLNRDLRKAR